ncbi:DUF4190 domain-containing protein [Pseudarthrobacter sp. PS3-L1]|uniref:DUF4190 domain-containing protein n=1 Tax=Pseudarthrobacter sp. PS3-L1 TaxID=3046207 RepID=UPI0024BAEF35|nr:DUF4190 domain-containing protein [Pseudarthrobacter sp. PS3-L1]MDJ0320818.1 DUF4190 domain-containing protein [Pseudarthrobacter sp. PS3-L1]
MTDQPSGNSDAWEGGDATASGKDGAGRPVGYEPPPYIPAARGDTAAPAWDRYTNGGSGQDSSSGDFYATGGYSAGTPSVPGPYPQYGPPAGYGQNSSAAQPGPGYYGAGPYGGRGTAPQPRTLSIVSLVLGLVSLFFGAFMIPQIAAVIAGHLGLRREPAGKGMSITGLVLGYLCFVGYGLLWLVMIIFFATFFSDTGYGTSGSQSV